MKRTLIAASVATLMSSSAMAENIGVSIYLFDDVWTTVMRNGITDHADTLEGVDVQVFNPDVESEGWYAPVTVIRTNIGERPFIVDSIREYLNSKDLPVEAIVYPVIHTGPQRHCALHDLGG